MKPYSEHRPTGFDTHLEIRGEESREEWYVLPCRRNRDSGCLEESNFHTAVERLGGDGADVEVHRFGHWACGWYEIIVVRPNSAAHYQACAIDEALENYPILDEDDFSERERQAADETWKNCYSHAERISYIRANRDDFEFQGFADLLGCVRGKFFCGDVPEMAGP